MLPFSKFQITRSIDHHRGSFEPEVIGGEARETRNIHSNFKTRDASRLARGVVLHRQPAVRERRLIEQRTLAGRPADAGKLVPAPQGRTCCPYRCACHRECNVPTGLLSGDRPRKPGCNDRPNWYSMSVKHLPVRSPQSGPLRNGELHASPYPDYPYYKASDEGGDEI